MAVDLAVGGCDSDARLSRAAAERAVQAGEELPMGPWVIVGTVDRRRFYLRERGEVYCVVIAADAHPTVDPWTADHENTVTIKTGSSDDLYRTGDAHVEAVHVSAAAVRTYLRQSRCTHPHGRADRYCAECGVPLVDPGARPTVAPGQSPT